MNTQIKNILLGILFSIFSISNLFASENQSDASFFSERSTNTDPGGHDSGDDPVGTAPIDTYLIVLIILGIVTAYYARNQLRKNIN